MALSYRSPIEDVLNRFTSEEQSRVSTTAVQRLALVEKRQHSFFSFALSETAKQKLSEAGIYLSPYSFEPHSHPACKTLENYFLFEVVAKMIDPSFFLVGIKNSKINFLKSRDSSLSALTYVNRYVTSMDKCRYSKDFYNASSNSHFGFTSKGKLALDGPTLSSLIPNVISSKSRNLFLHDELHYWDPCELCNFLMATRPEKLLATVVIPPELLIGSVQSLNPWCYNFSVSGSKFFFSPDSVSSEGYHQDLNCIYLLKAKRIVCPDGSIYSVDLVHSKFAHHLVCFTRGAMINQEVRYFNNFCATSPGSLSLFSSKVKDYLPIETTTVSKIYRYLRTLKKPDIQSCVAKLSQILPNPTGFEIKFAEEFGKLIIKHDSSECLIEKSLVDVVRCFFCGMLPERVARLVHRYRQKTLDEFIFSLKPLEISVDTIEVTESHHERFHSYLSDSELSADDFVNLFERFNSVPETPFLRLQSGPESYPIFEGMCLPVDINSEGILAPLIKNRLEAHSTEYLCHLTLGNVVEVLKLSIRPGFASFTCSFSDPEFKDRVKSVFVAEKRRFNRRIKVFFGLSNLLFWFTHRSDRLNVRYLKFSDENRSLEVEQLKTLNFLRRVLTSLMSKVQRQAEERKVVVHTPEETTSNFLKGLIPAVNQPESSTDSSVPAEPVEATKPISTEVEISQDLHQVLPNLFLDLDNSGELSVEQPENRDDANFQNVCLAELSLHPNFFPGANFDTSNLICTNLRGRRCWFFARCGCYTYGHDKVKYITNAWQPFLNQFIDGDSNYYNTCLLQEYELGSSIPFHADDEKCYSGSPVKTFNYGLATFKFRSKSKFGLPGVLELSLRSGNNFTMGANFQRRYAHSVISRSEGRVSLTFRRQDFTIEGTRVAHVCSTPDFEEDLFGVCIRRHANFKRSNFSEFEVSGDGNCFWHSMGAIMGIDSNLLKKNTFAQMAKHKIKPNSLLEKQMEENAWAEREAISIFCRINHVDLVVLIDDNLCQQFSPLTVESTMFYVTLTDNAHFRPALPKNGCVVKAISQLLNRREVDILSVLGRSENRHILETLSEGDGMELEDVEAALEIFSIRANVSTEKGNYTLNPDGRILGEFELKNSHLKIAEKRGGCSFGASSARVSHLPDQGVLDSLTRLSDSVKYSPNFDRAKVLAESLLSGKTGVISDSIIAQQQDWLQDVDSLNTTERTLEVILGTFGAGKSTLFKNFIKKNSSRVITFVSPRKVLAEAVRDDINTALGGKRRSVKTINVKTFETFLKSLNKVKNCTIIFDEIQLFPPGYIDLVLLKVGDTVKIFLTGDPCQSDFDSMNDRLAFMEMESDINHVLRNQRYKFNILSRRFRSTMFLKRLPCKFDRSNFVIEDDGYDVLNSMDEAAAVDESEYEVVLVSSFEEKRVVKSYLGSVKCLTFGESTGLNFVNGFIVVSIESINANERRWLTALSRFREKLTLINLLGGSLEDMAQTFHDRVLQRFLTAQASVSDLKNMLPGEPVFVEGFDSKIGKDEFVKEAKLAGDPWLKTEIFLGQAPDIEMEELVQSYDNETQSFLTHLPVVEFEDIRSRWVHRFKDRASREYRIGSEVSNQFNEDHSKNRGSILSNAAERFEAIYPRHHGNDSVTFLMAIKKRLRFSNSIRESRKLREAAPFGKFLLGEFLKRVPLRPEHDQDMFDEAEQDFFDKKVSKPAATLENHANRSCKDWLSDVALIFMKSQFCSKWDNRFRDAKAGQTLACFHHSVLCRFAPFIRYIEKKVLKVLPKNFYIHSGKGLEQLNEWVILNGFKGKCTESDYEAFDASQDQFTLAFELELMKFLRLPSDLIEDYRYIKLNLGSKLGSFAIMRFTGEAGTFLFNTLANMVFTFLRYDLNGSEAICFAGDDMCANSNLRVSMKNEGFLKKIKLKAKVEKTESPTFCGWHLSRYGIYKKPQLVLERLNVARETNNLHNCLDSYAIEVSFGYKLGELLNGLMSEEELVNHYSCVRFIIKHKSLMKSKIVDLFSSSG